LTRIVSVCILPFRLITMTFLTVDNFLLNKNLGYVICESYLDILWL